MKIIRRTLSLLIVVAAGFVGAPAEAQFTSMDRFPRITLTFVASEAFVHDPYWSKPPY